MVDIDIEMIYYINYIIYIYYSFGFPRWIYKATQELGSTAFVEIKLWNASISYVESYSYYCGSSLCGCFRALILKPKN